MEKIAGVEVSERARLIRTIMLELQQRITSHTLALGHMAEAMVYENLFMQFFRVGGQELILRSPAASVSNSR